MSRERSVKVPFGEAQTLYLIFGSERRGNGGIPARNEPKGTDNPKIWLVKSQRFANDTYFLCGVFHILRYVYLRHLVACPISFFLRFPRNFRGPS